MTEFEFTNLQPMLRHPVSVLLLVGVSLGTARDQSAPFSMTPALDPWAQSRLAAGPTPCKLQNDSNPAVDLVPTTNR